MGRDGKGRYDSTWTQVSGVPEEVVLALSSEDGNSGEDAGKRGERLGQILITRASRVCRAL